MKIRIKKVLGEGSDGCKDYMCMQKSTLKHIDEPYVLARNTTEGRDIPQQSTQAYNVDVLIHRRKLNLTK